MLKRKTNETGSRVWRAGRDRTKAYYPSLASVPAALLVVRAPARSAAGVARETSSRAAVRSASPAWAAQPNAGHLALVTLERRGKLHALVTQNIDGLPSRDGNSPSRVIEVHGTVWFTRCWDCDDRRPMDQALERVRAGDADPACLECGGILKSDTISFGQALVPEVIDRALQASDEIFRDP